MDIDEWRAVDAEDVACEAFTANYGGIDPERCWRVEFESSRASGDRREADVVLTAEGDFVRFGEPRQISR
jgi:hypothetical protein